MPLKAAKKTGMPMRAAPARGRVFEEVNFGYDLARAIFEAQRCLQCQVPRCEEGCPVRVPVKEFIHFIATGRFAEAARAMKRTNSLPGVCGRVCPQEDQCEKLCLYARRFSPVAIGHLERFIADWEMANGSADEPPAARRNEKIAIVGSGPSGLTAAGDLARLGYAVTVFEALHAVGGVLRYGIPEFRLPKQILDREIEGLKRLGVEFALNVAVGRTFTVDDLFDKMGYSAVFIGTGAGLPKFLGVEGENLCGVYSANEFLTRINLMGSHAFPEYDTPIKRGARVAVVGAGNTAMDAVRCALRMGAREACIVYRRSMHEMGARAEEYGHAVEEGVKFHWLTNPARILSTPDGWVRALECLKMELGAPDDSGRRRPVPVRGSEFVLEADTVVVAIGTSPNPLLVKTTPGLKTAPFGGLIVREQTGETSRENVYAGGDAVTGAATVISAAGAGKKAAAAIHRKLQGLSGKP